MSISFSRRLEIVLLPTPEGPTSTMSNPCCLVGRSIRQLFHVLHLLFQPIDRAFDLDDMPGDLRVVRLRRDRVGLAKHLLGDEVELSARVLIRPAGLLKRLEMMR